MESSKRATFIPVPQSFSKGFSIVLLPLDCLFGIDSLGEVKFFSVVGSGATSCNMISRKIKLYHNGNFSKATIHYSIMDLEEGETGSVIFEMESGKDHFTHLLHEKASLTATIYLN